MWIGWFYMLTFLGANAWNPSKRVQVDVDISNALWQGANIKLGPSGRTSWIDFKYEGLPDLCFACGRFGHSTKECLEEESKEIGRRLASNNVHGNTSSRPSLIKETFSSAAITPPGFSRLKAVMPTFSPPESDIFGLVITAGTRGDVKFMVKKKNWKRQARATRPDRSGTHSVTTSLPHKHGLIEEVNNMCGGYKSRKLLVDVSNLEGSAAVAK
ncbi:Zinc finger, CCHC-type [Parasponia andersonii]|uniref:Zinc finger, CCHC-type n=1 Tax=Parasponia andersonii TaxID=3476 RepID=A0A2P5B1K6_PARAD|nr:Zinc finger, CCHC-type [Parasponia andersonii]